MWLFKMNSGGYRTSIGDHFFEQYFWLPGICIKYLGTLQTLEGSVREMKGREARVPFLLVSSPPLLSLLPQPGTFFSAPVLTSQHPDCTKWIFTVKQLCSLSYSFCNSAIHFGEVVITHTAACGGCLPSCWGCHRHSLAQLLFPEEKLSKVRFWHGKAHLIHSRLATCNSLSAVLAHVPELQSNNPNV